MVLLWTLWGDPLIKVMGLRCGETAYISEVNGARKVKSHAQVATNKDSDRLPPAQNFSGIVRNQLS